MASASSLSQPNQPPLLQSTPHIPRPLDRGGVLPFPRRRAAIVAAVILSTVPPHLLLPGRAWGGLVEFNVPLVRPGQTMEEAMGSVRWDARSMLEEVKELIDSESWEEAQKELRKGSGALRRDFYTIIQGKPGTERPALRKLFSELFNGVTRLDYAARDHDRELVRRCFEGVSASLFDFLSHI
ncbi:hypothetical protein MLD38_006081 [Melastoma candidum]|uniref:Uncharacterized protein n=1 Tax=Melastoma candidum TaxID=119954 RepID=A0ACB9RPT2_9MYRT|nr:hypothetical protein MLD38_006081 [Melastoma candidum]